MRTATPLALLSLACAYAWAQSDAILDVVGRAVEQRSRYNGGGRVEFLDVSLADQLIHFASETEIPFRMTVSYRVLEPAPIWLTSRLGTEHWRAVHFATDGVSAIYTDEHIDLSQAGPGAATSTRARVGLSYGPPLKKGLAGVRGRHYFLIDQPDGKWLDVVSPPPFFNRPSLTRKLCFTLANLKRFALEISDFESTWQPGGPVRVRIMVTDADGDRFPVVNVKAELARGKHNAPLTTEFDELDAPTGWLRGALPKTSVFGPVTVRVQVGVRAPQGPRTESLQRDFAPGTGKRTPQQMAPATAPVRLPRTADGVVRETRGLWVAGSDIYTRQDIERLVDRAAEAKLNMLLPDVFVRDTFVAHSPLQPMTGAVEAGLDPLAYLITRAHARGLEVHPWFCVTYRDAAFRQRLGGVDMVDANGRVVPLGADVHRKKYRDFIVDLMVGVARDYSVDGIHLDYIRTMGRCYCQSCRTEFRAQFDRPLTEATDEEWQQWQRSAIGDIVQRTAEGVRNVRPHAVLSAAVFSNMSGGAAQGQDPAGWARNGWLDVVIPMDYDMEPLGVRAHEKAFLKALDDDDQLVTGLSLYVRNGRQVFSRAPERVRSQIRLVRRMGIHGYCLFVYRYLSDDLLALLRDEINPERAKPYFR